MDKTEEKLIKAANEVLARRGYDGATTLEIAKTAGVSEMTLFRKFKSRENLFRAAHYEKERQYIKDPSLYDYFYYDFAMLQKTLSLRNEVLENKIGSLLAGYLYFVEFGIGKLIQNVEEAPYNKHIFEMVNWGRFDVSDQEIQHLKKTCRPFKLVFDLNEIRSTLSGLRRKVAVTQEANDKKEIGKNLSMLEKLNNEINSELVGIYKAKRRQEVNDIAEKLMIFHWFMVTYVYEPPRLFFSTMSNQTAHSFMPAPQYLAGFKFCVERIMNWLTQNKYSTQIACGLSELKTLREMHEFYSKMHGTVFKGTKFDRIFDVIEPKWGSAPLLESEKVEYPYQLNLIFRGREIKAINVEEVGGIRSDRDTVQRVFIDAIFGDITLGVPQVEIVQFEELVEDGKDWDKYYSYALYLPMHGMIGDASSWLIFPRLDGTSNWEPYDDVSRYLENEMKAWGKRISLKKYKIAKDLLKKYIDNKDLSSVRKKDMEVRHNTGKGLLTEFLAYFYIWYLHKAHLVEFHKEENNTDVDVVADDETSRYIIQAKSSLSSDRKQLLKELDETAKQLKVVETQHSISTKVSKKVLFAVDWDWNESKFSEVDDWDNYLLDTYYTAKRVLLKYGIELIIYSRVKNTVRVEYPDFERKIKNALDLFDPEDL
jgi:hypothetical protein